MIIQQFIHKIPKIKYGFRAFYGLMLFAAKAIFIEKSIEQLLAHGSAIHIHNVRIAMTLNNVPNEMIFDIVNLDRDFDGWRGRARQGEGTREESINRFMETGD